MCLMAFSLHPLEDFTFEYTRINSTLLILVKCILTSVFPNTLTTILIFFRHDWFHYSPLVHVLYSHPWMCMCFTWTFCVDVCRSKPCKAGNEQAEDCSNDVTQMSWVQISRLKMRVEIRTSSLPCPSIHPAWDTIKEYLTAGNMCACKHVCACVYII